MQADCSAVARYAGYFSRDPLTMQPKGVKQKENYSAHNAFKHHFDRLLANASFTCIYSKPFTTSFLNNNRLFVLTCIPLKVQGTTVRIGDGRVGTITKVHRNSELTVNVPDPKKAQMVPLRLKTNAVTVLPEHCEVHAHYTSMRPHPSSLNFRKLWNFQTLLKYSPLELQHALSSKDLERWQRAGKKLKNARSVREAIGAVTGKHADKHMRHAFQVVPEQGILFFKESEGANIMGGWPWAFFQCMPWNYDTAGSPPPEFKVAPFPAACPKFTTLAHFEFWNGLAWVPGNEWIQSIPVALGKPTTSELKKTRIPSGKIDIAALIKSIKSGTPYVCADLIPLYSQARGRPASDTMRRLKATVHTLRKFAEKSVMEQIGIELNSVKRIPPPTPYPDLKDPTSEAHAALRKEVQKQLPGSLRYETVIYGRKTEFRYVHPYILTAVQSDPYTEPITDPKTLQKIMRALTAQSSAGDLTNMLKHVRL